MIHIVLFLVFFQRALQCLQSIASIGLNHAKITEISFRGSTQIVKTYVFVWTKNMDMKHKNQPLRHRRLSLQGRSLETWCRD